MSKVLSFGLVPGDIEMGCGGTEAFLAGQGHGIIHVYLCHPNENLSYVSQDAQAAADRLGVMDTRFLSLGQGADCFSREVMLEVAALIRQERPDAIFTFAASDPNPDHHGLSCLVRTAVEAAETLKDLPGKPWKITTMLGFELKPPMPDYQMAVNITGTVSRKVEAVAAYEGLATNGCHDAMEGLARYRGVTSRSGKYAEVFELIFGDPHALRD